MKEEYTTEKHHGWIIWLSIIAILLIGVGIFFYYTFFRQSNSELIEAVPTDVQFIFEINDNATFTQTEAQLAPYFNELFALDVLPAYETIFHKLFGKEAHSLSISGHAMENGTRILFNTRIEKAEFKKLLRALSIDPANYNKFEQYKIYTYGTNYKSMKFVYFNHILTISDDIELVKKSILQRSHPKNLLSDDAFKDLYTLTNKNVKQNWIIINNPAFGSSLAPLFTEKMIASIKEAHNFAQWAAYQLRISKNEIYLSGYTHSSADEELPTKRALKANVPEELLPFGTTWYHQYKFYPYALCTFSIAADSNQHFRYLVLMQDTVHKSLVPYGNVEKAEEMRNNYPNGIYPVTDSTFSGRVATEMKPYQCFIERNGYYIFAPSEEAMAYYTKVLASKGTIADNKYYKFSKSNIASSCVEEFNFYNSEAGVGSQYILTKQGKACLTTKSLSVFSTSCTGYSDGKANISIYLNFNK